MTADQDFPTKVGIGLAAPRLTEVLTHSSLNAQFNNERLAFLGDAVIELAARRHLMKSDAMATKGDLTQRKKEFVANVELAKIAAFLGLPPPRLGASMKATGPNRAVMAQVYEATLGAVFEEHGLEMAAELYLRHYQRFRAKPSET